MESKISKKDHYWVVAYEGDTTDLMPGPLPEVLDALQHGAQFVILDFHNLKHLTPNGVNALKESLEAVKKREASLGIASPQPQVRRALKLGGIVPSIPIFYNIEGAVANLDLVDYQLTASIDLTDRLLIIQGKLQIAGSLRDAFRKHPQKPHFRLIPVRDVKEAYKVLGSERVDCILIDCGLPLLQITSFIEKLETDSKIPTIPLIVIAQENMLAEAELIIRNGAHEILCYPFKPVEALVRIQTAISLLKDHRPFIPDMKVVQPRGYGG